MRGNDAIIHKLREQRIRITKKIIREAKKLCPIGETIRFEKWGSIITATVIEHDHHGEKMKVRTSKGKTYWLDYYYIFPY